MKKTLALLLTFCLLLQSVPVAATQTRTEEYPVKESVQDKQFSDVQEEKSTEEAAFSDEEPAESERTEKEETKIKDTETTTEYDHTKETQKETAEEQKEKAVGVLEVKVTSALPISAASQVTVTIVGGESEGENIKKEQTLTVSAEDAASAVAHFADLPVGEYTVMVSAKYFADYTQTVSVTEDNLTRITVCSAQMKTGNQAHPGWMLLGDVNDDKRVDEQDKQEILQVLHAENYEENKDVNRDHQVDLVDLQYIVQSMGENQLSTVETMCLPKEGHTVGGTVISKGNLENLFQDSGEVQLKTSTNQPISEDNPVGLEFSLTEEGKEAPVLEGMTIQAATNTPSEGMVNDITQGTVSVTYEENGEEKQYEIPVATEEQRQTVSRRKSQRRRLPGQMAARLQGARVTVDANGALTVDFGKQIAVKKVTIQITGTRKKAPLVDIAKVEFVNNMENRIPVPELDIPEIRQVIAENEALMVKWTKENNITGYEVYISGPVKKQDGNKEEVVRVADTMHHFVSINNAELKNFSEYTIKVRSVNGDWKSPWSEEIKAIPQPQTVPAPPDNVTAEGGFLSVSVKWKKMDDASGYMVYYREKGKGDFQPAVKGFVESKDGKGKIETNTYTITELKNETEYEIYVKGWNELGWGKPSLVSLATTKSELPPQVPNYKLINTPNGEGVLTNHITGAVIGGAYGAAMVGSPLDEGNAKGGLGLVDNDYASYWKLDEWDDGAANAGSTSSNGMTITLDQEYEMSYLTFGAVDPKGLIHLAKIRYWNEANPDTEQSVGATILEKKDKNGNRFYVVRFDHKITANKIHMRLGRVWVDKSSMKVGEIHFHQYDAIEGEILGLYADDTHTVLRGDVTETTINELETRLEQTDENGEKHPLYDQLKLDLQTARDILSGQPGETYTVINGITAQKDKHLGFGGLNPWQPLGKTVYAGETIRVFVGHSSRRNGEKADLQLVVTQYHPESSTVSRTIDLKVGKNELTIPQLADKNFERGGQIYIAYTGNNSQESYAVRVQGGSDIPVLNLYGKTGEERTAAIRAYVEALSAYQGQIGQLHNDTHKDSGNKSVNYDYDEQNCILNTTDILLQPMMYSLPATQVWESIKGSGNLDEQVKTLDNGLKAMEDTMTLFYQHKGLSDQAPDNKGKNAWPAQHLNIRYTRMFAGAFMYASGNHIGVEWDSTKFAGVKKGSELGWGLAHEIGHNINQNSYSIAEITNNYFAQLLTIKDRKTRFIYENVYRKVTSGAVGRDANVGTQLALYWQLHLAYDDQKDDHKIYEQYEDVFNQLFFARVDTYARNPEKAPKGTLKLNGDADQNLMRLACAAAQKDMLSFFIRWGMVPDEETKAYAANYEKEEKALYYMNDAARDYRVDHRNSDGQIDESQAITGKNVAVAKAEAQGSQVRVNITAQNGDNAGVIAGYEIIRNITANGETQSQVVGYQPADPDGSAVYTDNVTAINNRVLGYEVRPVDQFMNYGNPVSAGKVKVETNGSLAKENWTAKTTMVSDDDQPITPNEEDPDSGYNTTPGNVTQKRINSIERIFDGKTEEDFVYHGKVLPGKAGEITIDLHKQEQLTSLRYQGSDLAKLQVEVSSDGTQWTTVKANYTECVNAQTNYKTIWFDAVKEEEKDSWIGTYDARYLRLRVEGNEEVSIKEIELCGPSGDNLEFMTAGDSNTPAVGVLKEDYAYDAANPSAVIPAGSLLFTGTYKGNPAYNMVILYDQDGNVIGAKDGNVEAEQIIFAEVPENGQLGETSNGTWVYYITPGNWMEETVKGLSVRGELYRVDDAKTLEGERVVSDTLPISVPDVLPDITLTGTTFKK